MALSVLDVFDIRRFIEPLRNKIYLIIGRGIVKMYKNTEKTQKLQFMTFGDEIYEGVERMQEYGFETFPAVEAEEVHASMGGNKETSVVLVVHDRRYRPKDLVSGEVKMYTLFGVDHYIWMRSGKLVEMKGALLYAYFNTRIRWQSPYHWFFGFTGGDATQVAIGGASGLYKLIDERAKSYYNIHQHPLGDGSYTFPTFSGHQWPPSGVNTEITVAK